jgi:hypothetical protein
LAGEGARILLLRGARRSPASPREILLSMQAEAHPTLAGFNGQSSTLTKVPYCG